MQLFTDFVSISNNHAANTGHIHHTMLLWLINQLINN